jgi:glutamyl-tRNA synthetase
VTQFREEGYLPAAMVNYLATLGWNDGTEKEIYTVDELIQSFDIKRITKSPAVFDGEKLRWINGQHLRALSAEEIEPLVVDHWLKKGVFVSPGMAVGTALAAKSLALVQNALELVADCEREMRDVLVYPLLETIAAEEAAPLVAEGGGFKEISELVLVAFAEGSLPAGQDGVEHMPKWKAWVKATGKATGRKGKTLFHPLRLALTGKMSGPDVGAILEVISLAQDAGAAPTLVPLDRRMEILSEALSSM